ncbi:MAG: methionine--tRNA ligase [Methanobacteriota archaeon]|nr:MAG: methionine--tRNA ligase [Euryarchaeota archaeon]
MLAARFLVTAALPYANGPLHVGHIAGVYLPADIYVRYKRLRGDDVLFICGTDEYGTPIEVTARQRGVSPQEVVDYYYRVIKESFDRLEISFDYFSRTTHEQHTLDSQEFFTKLLGNGYIYRGVQQQLYCDSCGRFLVDRYVEGVCPRCGAAEQRGNQCEECSAILDPNELVDPRCVLCGSTPRPRETEHWFLRLSAFEDRLREWLEKNKHWKSNVVKFCLNWIEQGLVDRAITRDMEWGVPVPIPGVRGKVLYVWFDAPIGYITATKEWALERGDPSAWERYWKDPETRLVHFLAKDNIPFHAIIFPSMLMGVGEGYVLPWNIPANEYLNLEGRHISTSRNWAIWVHDFLERFPADYLRYYLAAICPETRDSSFSWRDFQEKINNELADVLGNFVHRTCVFTHQFFGGVVPEPGTMDEESLTTIGDAKKSVSSIGDDIENFRIKKALRQVMQIAKLANKYFNMKKPWETVKVDRAGCATTLYVCHQLVGILAHVLYPFMPSSAKKIWGFYKTDKKLEELRWGEELDRIIVPGTKLGKVFPLFEKIDDAAVEREIKNLRVLSGEEAEEHKPITVDEFSKIEMRVARVEKAERIPGSEKLLKLVLDVGRGKKQVVAGIGKDYSPEHLENRLLVVVTNLKPAKIMGVVSEGMVLAIESSEGVSLIVPDKKAVPGDKVS